MPFKGINFEANSESTSPVQSLMSTTLTTTTTTHVLTSLDPATKLEKILKHLPQQQDVVRNKMIEIILDQIEEVKQKARKELENNKILRDRLWAKEEKERERLDLVELEEMLRRLKAPPKERYSYELHPESSFNEGYQPLPEKPRQDIDGDVEMNTGLAVNAWQNTRQIKDQLAQDMLIIVRCGLRELDKYDRHCRSVLQPYESSLARRTAGPSRNNTDPKSNPKMNSMAPQATKLGSSSRIGATHDVGRLSNGMPVSMERHPASKIESLGELMRRSNK